MFSDLLLYRGDVLDYENDIWLDIFYVMEHC